jgi:methyl-accepting chemotaxis protein
VVADDRRAQGPSRLSQANTISQQLSSLLQATQQQQLVAIVVITLVAPGLLVWFIQTITAPLLISRHVSHLASNEGDLTQQMRIDTHQELIELGRHLNAFLGKLRAMVQGSKQIGQQVHQQARGMKQTADASVQPG